MNDLIERLKALARAEHDDVSVAAEAAVMIEKLADGIDSLSMHGVRDYGWSVQGFHRPFQAIREWYEIVVQEKRYDVPEEPVHLRRPMPETRYLYVGKDWDEGISWVSGLREVALDMVREPGMGGCMDNRLLSNGHVVLDINTEDNFDVDIEGAALALDFERDYMLAVNAEASPSKGLTEGALWWLRMGVVSLSPGQIATHHRILARTGFKERHGLAGAFCDLDEVIARSISKDEYEAAIAGCAQIPSAASRERKWTQLSMF
jgi:hypothetical protein